MNDERTVRILKSINAIRTRPGQYIGDTSTCDHLIHECIDNFFDELRNDYGDSAEISFMKNGEVVICDNGRGLPLGETIDEESGKKMDSIEGIFTKLHSGTKFSIDDDKLKSLFGQNGVGLVAVNALSEFVQVLTQRKNFGAYKYIFKDSILVQKDKIDDFDKWSTIILFKPNKKYFESIVPDYKSFLNRIKLGQAKIPNSQFLFNKKPLKKQTMEEFVRERLCIDKKTPLFSCDYSTKNMTVVEPTTGKSFKLPGNISVFLTYEAGDTIIDGDVNLRFCDGTYLTSVQTAIKTILPSKLSKKFQNTPERFLIEGLRLYVSLQIPFPRFDSQTKVRMVLDVKNDLIAPLDNKLNKILSEGYIIKVVEFILNQKLGNLSNVTKKKKISSENKLRDCINKPGDVLYIVEGDSAESVIHDCREPETEASLPLRGKVINVEKQTLAKIKENQEIKNILEAVGQAPYRYKAVKIVCDADCDGLHIIVLIILIFCKYFRDLVSDGRLSVVLPPLYGATKKEKFIPIYNINDTVEYKNKGYEIRRFKGLGEMNSDQMRAVLDQNIEYIIELPESEKIIDDIIMIITSAVEKRKFLNLKEEFNFESFISDVFEKLKNKKPGELV